ncbi:MAG: putative T7SS-secreted protein, partial [Sciscionella sp.]
PAGHWPRPGGALMAELGETSDPKALVPGDYSALQTTVSELGSYGDVLHEAGAGLTRIDTTEGWSGKAADQFRDVFGGQPGKWPEAGDSFQAASRAVDDYSSTMLWAQGQAADAIRQWEQARVATEQAQSEHAKAPPGTPFHDPGDGGRQAAQDTLARARHQLDSAGDAAADAVDRATSTAPEKPGIFSKVTSGLEHTLGQAAHTVVDAGKEMVNGAASFGNAALHHPLQFGTAVAGLGLTAVSGLGEGAGGVLDATGVGAVGGVPLGAVSTAGVVAGVGITGAATGAMATEAAGEDHVRVFNTDSSGSEAAAEPGEDPPFPPPKKINGYRGHARERMFENSRGDGGVNDKAAQDAIDNPTVPPEFQADDQGGKYLYQGKDADVTLNRDGEVVTAWPKNSAGRRFPDE